MPQEENPYPKLWNRRQADKRKKAAQEAPKGGKEAEGGKEDDTKRRKTIDDFLERANKGQSTDSNNP